MVKLLLVALLCLVFVAAASCGGNGSAPVSAIDPNGLLLRIDDLPKGSAIGQAPPELCGPIPILEKNGGRTAISKTLLVGEARIVEAVGVFNTPKQAESAYDELNERKRLECISNAINVFSSASSVKMTRPQSIDPGDEGTLVRYLALDGRSKTQGYSDVLSIRDAQCTASLLIAVGSSEPSNVYSNPAGVMTAELLSEACG